METHPESYNEGFFRNAALAGAMALAGTGIGCNRQAAPTQAPQQSSYRSVFHSPAKEAMRQHQAANKAQLQKAGRTSGTFVQGQLQPEQQPVGPKTLRSQSVTSPEAASFLQ